MSYYSVWPMLLIVAAVFGCAASPLFRAADSPPISTHTRVQSLDGLRGFLALAVFFHHGALYHTYIQDGLWSPPTDRLYGLLGSFGVAIFFMITGFLFWSQILAKKGRPDWVQLYIGRVFRIGPIYLVAIALMVLCVFVVTGPHLRVSAGVLAEQLSRWSILGLSNNIPVNGMAKPGVFLAFVTWSLRWEWFFYGSLLVTALFARHRVTSWMLPSIGLVGAVLVHAHAGVRGPSIAAFVALFCVGMLTATARELVSKVDFRRPLFSVIATMLILTVLTLTWTAYQVLSLLLLASAFFLIANGTTIFGILSTRPARRLGDVSFGIYLLQGLVLTAVFAMPAARAFALSSPIGHWLLVALAAFVLVSAATMAHALIERPGVELGRRVNAFVRSSFRRTFAKSRP